MSSDSTHSDHLSSVKPVFVASVGNRTRSRVLIPNTGDPQDILMKPPNAIDPLKPLSLIDLGDDWSDNEEVSKPEFEPESFLEPDFQSEISVEREPFKQEIVPFCEKSDSIMTSVKLERLFEECHRPVCKITVPEPGERAHRFDLKIPKQGIPHAVISAAFLRVGVSMPLHPFLREVLDFYQLAPMQLTPNSYRLAISTFILYSSKFTVPLTAPELGYFFRLKDTGRNSGCFYLSAWPCHQGQCIKNVKQNFEQWSEQFLYCYDCPYVRYEFNCRPNIPKQTVLTGVCLERATKILKLSASTRDCLVLMTPDNLMTLGFIPSTSGRSLYICAISFAHFIYIYLTLTF